MLTRILKKLAFINYRQKWESSRSNNVKSERQSHLHNRPHVFLFCPQPEDFQFNVTEGERNHNFVSFKQLLTDSIVDN